MNNRSLRLASLAILLVVAIMGSASAAFAQTRLTARKNKVINGIEAQLRGDYRANPHPIRLDAELENINIPIGTKVAFCLLQNGVSSMIGVGQVTLVGGIPTASIELDVSDGDIVSTVNAGDVLQARQRKLAPFRTSPTCGTALLVSAAFQ